MNEANRTALVAKFDQLTETAIAASIREAAEFDHLDGTAAVMASFEKHMLGPASRETLAMMCAQLGIRFSRTVRGVQ